MEETNNLIFTLTAILAIAMTLIYFPLRFFLTLTARSRRLKLLQKKLLEKQVLVNTRKKL